MKLNPRPVKKVRLLTTFEGKFVSLHDMKAQLKDDAVIDTSLAMLKIGHDKGDDIRTIMRRALASFIAGCAGEV